MDAQLRAERSRLARFLAQTLTGLGRSERQRWGEVYVRGLLSSVERKTAARLAQRLPDGDEQALQQFVGQSPWAWEPVRERLAQQTIKELEPVAAWVVDDTGFPKKGGHSVGVARQYSGTLGKIGNCQVAVSLHYVTDDAAVPLDFALYLPEEWLESDKRTEAGIPEEVTFQPKWQLALDLIDRALEWGIKPGVVAADAGYGGTVDFRLGLAKRRLQFAVGITSTVAVWLEAVSITPPAYTGKGRPRRIPANLPRASSVLELGQQLPAGAWQAITWREGTKGPMTSRFAAVRVRPSRRLTHHRPAEDVLWLLMEWLDGEAAPSRFWLSNVAADTDLPELVRLVKIRWWIEQGYQQLKDDLGLDHYEGRTWRGWHHHVTLTMIAFAFLVLEMRQGQKNFWTDYAPASRPA